MCLAISTPSVFHTISIKLMLCLHLEEGVIYQFPLAVSACGVGGTENPLLTQLHISDKP